jgi:MYXO-CTERM domain-containing protein
MNNKLFVVSSGILALGLLLSTGEAEARRFDRYNYKKPSRAVPELSVKHAAVPGAFLLAGVAAIAGRRRKQQK